MAHSSHHWLEVVDRLRAIQLLASGRVEALGATPAELLDGILGLSTYALAHAAVLEDQEDLANLEVAA